MVTTAVAKQVLQHLLTSQLTLDKLKTALFYYVLLKHAVKVKRHLAARGVTTTLAEFWTWLSRRIILLVLRLPSMKLKVATEMAQVKRDIDAKFIPKGENVTRHLSLPEKGRSPEWILAEMEKMDAELGGKSGWRHGKLSGAVYHGGDALSKVINDAFERYTVSNPLHPDVFPAIRKMEAEITSMCLRMFNNPNGAATTTAGGTESIIMSVKTHRDWARDVKGIKHPEILVPASAHAAFWKAGDYLGVKVHMIPVDPITRKVNLKRVKRAINPNTIMLVGSAINFPDGNQDDITSLGALAAAYAIGLHVDCCLGSFIVAHLEKAGLAEGESGGKYKLEPFDFRVKGVTSISCDTHKYGFAPKGSSVIMYRDANLRKYQYYIFPDWAGGLYASPSMAGSRPGALIAGTWAVMQYVGSEGYIESCRSIVSCTREIANRITNEIPELYILGNPPASVVAFGSQDAKVNVLNVGDAMGKRGWHLNALNGPAAVHIACTTLTVPLVEEFIADLKDSVTEARLTPNGKGTMVTVYGLGTSSAVGPTMVTRLATMFLDALYQA